MPRASLLVVVRSISTMTALALSSLYDMLIILIILGPELSSSLRRE
jgi:hypothetical protein